MVLTRPRSICLWPWPAPLGLRAKTPSEGPKRPSREDVVSHGRHRGVLATAQSGRPGEPRPSHRKFSSRNPAAGRARSAGRNGAKPGPLWGPPNNSVTNVPLPSTPRPGHSGGSVVRAFSLLHPRCNLCILPAHSHLTTWACHGCMGPPVFVGVAPSSPMFGGERERERECTYSRTLAPVAPQRRFARPEGQISRLA